MSCKPGSPKTGGRVKGTPNKATARTKDQLQAILDDFFEPAKYKEWFESLKTNEQADWMKKVVDVMVPKTVEIADSQATKDFFEGVKTEMYATWKKGA